jgi:hypothetical protein
MAVRVPPAVALFELLDYKRSCMPLHGFFTNCDFSRGFLYVHIDLRISEAAMGLACLLYELKKTGARSARVLSAARTN